MCNQFKISKLPPRVVGCDAYCRGNGLFIGLKGANFVTIQTEIAA